MHGHLAQTTSTLDIITLVVAIVGVMLALASLVWQGAVFVLSGSRVRVNLRRGALRRDAAGAVARIAGPTNPTGSDYALIHNQGFTEDVLIVDVRNVGRMAVSVEQIAAASEDGWGFARLADPENPALPHRLEPGAKETWHVEMLPFQRLVDADSRPRRAWITVELGTGRVVQTKDSTLIVPSPAPTP